MKHDDAERQQQADFDNHQHQAAREQRQQKISAAHGRAHKALQQFALPHIHQRKAYAPHAGVHQVHSQQSGNQKVDIARARLGRSHDGRGNDIFAARCRLQRGVHFGFRENAFWAGRVIDIPDVAAIHLDDQIVPAQPKSLSRVIGRK